MSDNCIRLAPAGLIVMLSACGESLTDPGFTAEEFAAARTLSLEACSPGQGGFTAGSDHTYFPLQVGYIWNYRGEEDGELVELRITVLNETEVVSGVTTRVVEEREWIDGELIEVSRNYFAQAPDGSVCYFGEAVDIYDPETGEVVSHEGAWRADEGENGPGIIMPASPTPGLKFVMEVAPGIAEDQGTVIGSGPLKLGEWDFSQTIRIREYNPLDGGKGTKVYAAGVGLVIDGPVQLTSYNF